MIEAEPVNQSRGFLASLILGFGPVILLIALFVYFARRAGGGAMSALGNFGRAARAASRAASRRSPSRTSPASTRPRPS